MSYPLSFSNGQVRPGDLVGVNKDSYLVLETLPAEFDSRVKAMEVDEKPTEDYSDIGGCDKQIQELIEAVVLPMTHKDLFDAIGVRPPKGVRETRESAALPHSTRRAPRFLCVHAHTLPVTLALFVTRRLHQKTGVLLYGPPGTGKTLLARACAKHTDAVFLKLAGPQLVQMFIGDGAKLVRDAFDLAKEKIKEGNRKGGESC